MFSTYCYHDIAIIVEKKVSWKFRNKEKVYFGNIRSLAAPAFGNEDNYYQFITKERAPQTHNCQSLVKINTVTDLQDTWPWLHCSHSGHFATLICSNDTEHGCCTIPLAVPSLWITTENQVNNGNWSEWKAIYIGTYSCMICSDIRHKHYYFKECM